LSLLHLLPLRSFSLSTYRLISLFSYVISSLFLHLPLFFVYLTFLLFGLLHFLWLFPTPLFSF
jgi:hypothetical protein